MSEDTKNQNLENEHVLNKKAWHEQLGHLVPEAIASGKPLAVLLMDLDSFKSVNDTLGHIRGDEVIAKMREILGLIAQKLRTGDANQDRSHDYISASDVTLDKQSNAEAGRFGGDEFGILIETSEAGATVVAGRIREVFRQYIGEPENKDLQELGIDISIGLATLNPEDDEPTSSLLRRADEALYKEKMNHLPDLTEDQKRMLLHIKASLETLNIRPRDLAKFLGRIAVEVAEHDVTQK